MKKVVVSSPGSYDKLVIKEAPDLIPKEDQVLIKVSAIGVNFADVCVRLGIYASAKKYVGWPITPGFEVSGEIISIGSKVTKFKVGEKVIGFTRFDAYATQVCVSEKQVLKIPQGFSLEESAGFAAVFFTAYHALYQHIVLPKNAKVLIHSAAGGVGTALVQLCKAAGYYTVGVIGSSHKRAYLENFHPDQIIDKSKEDLWTKASDFSPEGYNAIFDANGFSTLKKSYQHLSPTGKLITYGAHNFTSKKGGLNYLKAVLGMLKMPKFNPLEMISENKSIVGFNISFLFEREDMISQCVHGLEELLKKGGIKPIPITKIDFDNVSEAHKLIQSGQSVGKIVLII